MSTCDKVPPLKRVVNNIWTVIGDLRVWGAGVAPVVAVVTGSVLQTEAGLVALSHWVVSLGIQQLVVAELIHAVEVPVDQQQCSLSATTHPQGHIRSVVNRLPLHYLKDRIGLVRPSGFSHLLTFRLLAKKIYTVCRNSLLALRHMCSLFGFSTVDSLFHNITMDWGSWCRISANQALFPQLSKDTEIAALFLFGSLFFTTSFLLCLALKVQIN